MESTPLGETPRGIVVAAAMAEVERKANTLGGCIVDRISIV